MYEGLPRISQQVMDEHTALAMAKRKIYRPELGDDWIDNHGVDRLTYMAWLCEMNLCIKEERELAGYGGDPNDAQSIFDRYYPEWLQGVYRRLGDKDFERYQKMPYLQDL